MGDAFGLSPYFSTGNMLRRIKNKGKLLASANCCAADFTIVSSTLKKIGRFIAPVRKSWGFSFFWPLCFVVLGRLGTLGSLSHSLILEYQKSVVRQTPQRAKTCIYLRSEPESGVRHIVFYSVFTTKNRAHYDHMTLTSSLFFIKFAAISTKRKQSDQLARDRASALPVCAQSE